MQRRDFVRGALLGAGATAVVSLPLVGAAAGTRSNMRCVLSKAQASGNSMVWRQLAQCTSEHCGPATRMRVSIGRLWAPAQYRALSVDAMYAADHGLAPFRVASSVPGAVSAHSKPVAFDIAASGLAGLRIEHDGKGLSSATIVSTALQGPGRPTLAAGRYLLALTDQAQEPELGGIDAGPQPLDPVAHRHGVDPTFAYLVFSVSALDTPMA